MTSTALRIYTVVLGLVCAGAVVLSLHAQNTASGWQSDARAWQQLVRQTIAHDRMASRKAHKLAVRYNKLVRRTSHSQRRLLVALKRSRTSGGTVYAPQSTIYRTVSSGSSAAPVASAAPAPAPVAAPSPAPTTRTS